MFPASRNRSGPPVRTRLRCRYDRQYALVSNTNTSCNSTALLSSTLASGDVYTVCKSRTGDADDPVDAIKNDCDQEMGGVMNFNGNDRLVVFEDADGSDAFGETAVEPSGDPWKDALYRRCDFTPYDGTTSFDVTTYYDAFGPTETSNWGVAPSEGCTQ